jgi:hypothetical protein
VDPMMTCSVAEADTNDKAERKKRERQRSFMVCDESHSSVVLGLISATAVAPHLGFFDTHHALSSKSSWF